MKSYREEQIDKSRKLAQMARVCVCCALVPIPPLVVAACLSVPYEVPGAIVALLAINALTTTPFALASGAVLGVLSLIRPLRRRAWRS